VRYLDSVLGHSPRLNQWLRDGLATATSAAIRTSFLSASGVEEMAPSLAAFLERGGHLLFVAGGASEQAEPDALIALSGMLRPYPSAALRVVVNPEEFQNAKTYHLTYPDGHAEAWIGSSNFTYGGMESNHEASVILDSRQAAEAEIVDVVLRGTEAFRDRPGSTPVTEDTRLLLATRQASAARRRNGVRGRQMRQTFQLEELLMPALDRLDALAGGGPPRGMSTGFADVDAITGGLLEGSLTIVAGRPAAGASTLLLNILQHVAIKTRLRTALFCLDETIDHVVSRVLCAQAVVRQEDFRDGRMDEDGWARLARRMPEVADAPLLLNSTPAADLDALCAQVKELHEAVPLRLVAIDPINMIDAGLDRSASREREVSTVARRLKVLALELRIPIVVTAELSRAVENRADKRPGLGDLRDSDTLGQVADIVMLLHRPDAYDRNDPRAGEADLVICKHRNGSTATVTVAHQLHYGRFVNLPTS